MFLPLANIWHHKLRSFLSALGIGVGVCMLLTLSGLARGSLYEVADRWESVDADLIVYPRGWGENASVKSGAGLWDKFAGLISRQHPAMVERVVPVFTWTMKVAGQDQMVAGIDPQDWPAVTGGRQLSQGRLFDPDERFSRWIETALLTAAGEQPSQDSPAERLKLDDPEHDGMEMVIDSRLARAGGFRAGETIQAADHHWKIVGVVPAGVMTRVLIPRRTAQYLFNGSINQSTLMFVKLKAGVELGPAAEAIRRSTSQEVVPLNRYRGMLVEKFAMMFTYVDAVNAIALAIAFLFIMVTLYTTVLQRTREIAILRSFGASDGFILKQVVAESLVLTAAGTGLGIALSFLAAWAITAWNSLLTVNITLQWLGISLAAAAAGAVASAVYPAWRAVRIDMVEALTLE